MRYDYPAPGADPDQLDAEARALGLPGYQGLCVSGAQVQFLFAAPLPPADLGLLDAAVAAHVPPTRAQRKRREAMARVTAGDEATVRLRAALKVVMQAVAADRLYMAQLRGALQSLGASLPPPPPVRTWAQLEQAVRQAIEAGEGDGEAAPEGSL